MGSLGILIKSRFLDCSWLLDLIKYYKVVMCPLKLISTGHTTKLLAIIANQTCCFIIQWGPSKIVHNLILSNKGFITNSNLQNMLDFV